MIRKHWCTPLTMVIDRMVRIQSNTFYWFPSEWNNGDLLGSTNLISGNTKRVKALMKIMDVNGHDSEGLENTPLIQATATGNWFYLFQHLFNIFCYILNNYVYCLGREEIVKLLMENGANVNLSDSYWRTPLHIAVSYGKLTSYIQWILLPLFLLRRCTFYFLKKSILFHCRLREHSKRFDWKRRKPKCNRSKWIHTVIWSYTTQYVVTIILQLIWVKIENGFGNFIAHRQSGNGGSVDQTRCWRQWSQSNRWKDATNERRKPRWKLYKYLNNFYTWFQN